MTKFNPRLISPLSRKIRTDCPECRGGLAVMRVIPGREGSEYWTMRCTRCGGDRHAGIDDIEMDAAAEHASNPLA